jgi:hypothetical protein
MGWGFEHTSTLQALAVQMKRAQDSIGRPPVWRPDDLVWIGCCWESGGTWAHTRRLMRTPGTAQATGPAWRADLSACICSRSSVFVQHLIFLYRCRPRWPTPCFDPPWLGVSSQTRARSRRGPCLSFIVRNPSHFRPSTPAQRPPMRERLRYRQNILHYGIAHIRDEVSLFLTRLLIF